MNDAGSARHVINSDSVGKWRRYANELALFGPGSHAGRPPLFPTHRTE